MNENKTKNLIDLINDPNFNLDDFGKKNKSSKANISGTTPKLEFKENPLTIGKTTEEYLVFIQKDISEIKNLLKQICQKLEI